MEKLQTPPAAGAYCAEEDEIDLFELWENLVSEWKTVALTIGIVIALALGYVFTATPVYKSSTYLIPPNKKNVQPMNALNVLLNTKQELFYTPKQIFKKFLINLSSRKLKRKIFEEYDLATIYVPNIKTLTEDKKIAALDKALEEFNKDLKIEIPKRKKTQQEVTFSLTLKKDANMTAQIINDAVQKARLMTINQIYNDIMSNITIYKKQTYNTLAALRKTAKDRRLDRIARLNEAISIAKTLNIATFNIGLPTTVNLNKKLSKKAIPLYFYGYKFLEAEKQSLENRTNDDPFIDGLRDKEDFLNQLTSLKINKKEFDVVQIDQPALPAINPIKPKKALILAVAGITGLMLGIFIALIRGAYKRRRLEEAAA